MKHIDGTRFNFNLFVPVFEMIYIKYIENGSPLMVNIGHGIRKEFDNTYNLIQIKKRNDTVGINSILSEDVFWKLWQTLCETARITAKLLKHSYGRLDLNQTQLEIIITESNNV